MCVREEYPRQCSTRSGVGVTPGWGRVLAVGEKPIRSSEFRF